MLAGAFPSFPLTLSDTDTLTHCKHAHTARMCVSPCVFDGDTKREKAEGGNSDGYRVCALCALSAREQASVVVCK